MTKGKKTAEELAAMILQDLSNMDGCPKHGVTVTVDGLNPWNSIAAEMSLDGVRLDIHSGPAGWHAVVYGSSPNRVAQAAAAAKSLHDRLVAIDGRRIWTVGQSFNALATRAPTSIVEVDQETTALKLSAYEEIWNSATPIPQA